jgi:urea transport system permease protein
MDVPHSIRMVLWVGIGRRATLIGPILGTLLVNFGENALSESYPAMWSLMMGAAFLACILLCPWPDGLVKMRSRLDQAIDAKRACIIR